MAERAASLTVDVHTAGSEVWVRDDMEGWLKATVLRVDGSQVVVKTEADDERTVPVSECPLQNNDARAGVEVRPLSVHH
jgi:Myosin N-terminal SH3-like domain